MNCASFRKNFSAFLEGELDKNLQALCDSHLGLCRKCARLLSAYRTGLAGLAGIAEFPAPDDLFERVLAGVSPVRVKNRLRRLTDRWVPLATAAMLVIALSVSMFQSGQNQAANAEADAMVSTLDLVTVQLFTEKQQDPKARVRAVKAYLTSYSPGDNVEEEAVLSYGVSRHPVLVESGVQRPKTE